MNTAPDPAPPSTRPAEDITVHHEVPEGRIFTGHHMVFKAAVFGELVSDGGQVQLDDVLGWGKVLSHRGHIRIKKRAFNATVEATGGTVQIGQAESSFIVGREVRLRSAVNCRIVAHTLHLDSAEGCVIAARDIHIGSAKPKKSEPTVVTVVAPLLPPLAEAIQPFADEMAQLQPLADARARQIEALKADTAFASFLVIRGKIRTGMVKLTDAQLQGYQQMEERFAASAQALEAAVAERRGLVQSLAAAKAQLQSLQDERLAALQDCRCRIGRVEGETIVRETQITLDDPDVSELPGETIMKIFNRNDASVRILFSAAHGRFDWKTALY